MGVGLIRFLQPWDILFIYCNNQFKKCILSLLRVATGGTLHPPSDVYVRSLLCPFLYFIKHIKKQRHYFANKGQSSQGYGFSSGHVWMWELDCEESWAPKNWYIWISSNEVDETGTYYTEWSKPERKTPIQYTNAYIWNLERW